MSDQHVDDLLDLYTLGALEPAELADIERHLEACSACRTALEQSRRLVEHLAWSPPQHEPPSELRMKVRRRVESLQRGERALPAVRAGRPWYARFLGRSGLLQGLAVASLLLLVVLASWNLRLQGRLRVLTAELREQQQVAAMLSAPEVRMVHMVSQPAAPTARGSLVLDPGGNGAYLVAEGLPELPADKAYQLWLAEGEGRTSAAVFRADNRGAATVYVHSEKPMRTYTGCGITIEPATGSPRPTGDRVLRAESWTYGDGH